MAFLDTIKPVLDRVRKRFAEREDTEHKQALIRLGVGGAVLVYLAVIYAAGFFPYTSFPDTAFLVSAFFTAAFAILFWIYFRPGISHVRRYVGTFLDMGAATTLMHFIGEPGAPVFVVLLWVTFGNSFRYGSRYTMTSAAIGVLAFLLMAVSTPYWSDHYSSIGAGVLLALVVLPYYINELQGIARHALDRAEAANQAKSRFLANISHDLRTPLNGILGTAQILSVTTPLPHQRDHIKTIRTSAATMLGLIEGLLDLAAIEAKHLLMQSQRIDLRRFLDDVTRIIEPIAHAKNLVVTLTVSEDVPAVLFGSEAHIRQVLLNIVGNAVKFTKSGGVSIDVKTDSVTTRPDRTTLVFTVSDTGPGIPEEARTTIFDRFSRVDPSDNKGMGLGAHIARELVEYMGGQIGFESIVGTGTTFWIRLPLETSPAPNKEGGFASLVSPTMSSSLPDSAGRPANWRRLDALVVDDEEVNVLVAKAILEHLGHKVATADSGEAMLNVLEYESFDIVFLDINMPGIGGLEAVKQLRVFEVMRGYAIRTPVVAMTGIADMKTRTNCIESGFDEFMTKPISIEGVASVIDGIVVSKPPPQHLPAASSTAPSDDGTFNEGVLDMDIVNNLESMDRGGGFFAALVETFAHSGERMTGDIERALWAKSPQKARDSFHALKGAAANIGATRLSGACEVALRLPDDRFLVGGLAHVNQARHLLDKSCKELKERTRSTVPNF